MKILIANNARVLAVALGEYTNTATVEAEFGNEVVAGSLATFVHHGRYSDRAAPCIAPMPREAVDAIGLSHLDLDALGGVLGLLGRRRDKFLNGDGLFWQAAAAVDVRGPHRLEEVLLDVRRMASECSEDPITDAEIAEQVTDNDIADVRRLLQAWWAWSQEHRIYPPRDGTVADVTKYVMEACETIERILAARDDDPLLTAGGEWAKAQATLNIDSYVGMVRLDAGGPGVVVRTSDRFVNHLYDRPDGVVEVAVAALRTDTRAVTVSLADPVPSVSCRAVAQQLWGSEAGGRDGIAGSPRGQEMAEQDRNEAAAAMAAVLAR